MSLKDDMKQRLQGRIPIFHISLFLLLFVTSIIVITSFLLLLGMTVTKWTILYALFFSVGFLYLIKPDKKKVVWIVLAALLVCIALIYSSACVYDTTWDGSAYHKTAVGLLKEGWNPVYQSSNAFNSLSQSIAYDATNPLKWAEAYPKASWYFASTIYAFTGNIESGKVYTLLFMFIVFGLFYDYLSCKNIKKWKVILVCILAAFNPISFAQMQSYYIDGMVTSILMCLILLFISYFDADYHRSKIEILAAVACLIILGCNLKFSVVLFTASYCIMFFLFSAWRNYKNGIGHISLRLFAFFSGIGSFSVLIVGFAPYITNIKRYRNMFYGFTDLMGGALRTSGAVEGLNNFQMFWASLFGKMSHGEYKTLGDLLKLPFTVNSSELQYYSFVDTRVGGFGILFSGIFVLSSIVLFIYLLTRYKQMNSANVIALLLSAISFLEITLLPGTFQARYVGQIYLMPLCALILLFINHDKKTKKINFASHIAAAVLVVSMICNIAPWLIQTKNRFVISLNTSASFEYLQKNSSVAIAMWDPSFTGINFNFKDYNLKYKLIPYEKIDDTYTPTYGGLLYYKVENGK